MPQRNNCFDFLRFIFAFNVVLGHLFIIALFPEFKVYQGIFDTYLSVSGFFVISGYLITQSYEHSSSLKSYFIKRAKRLLPAYWLVVISCAIGLVTLSDLSHTASFSSFDFWEYFGANLSFLNFLHPALPGVFNNPFINDNSVNPALWTLKIEVGFYLCIPILMWALRKIQRPWMYLLLIYCCAVAFRNTLTYMYVNNGVAMYKILAHQLPGFMSYFAVGITTYIYKEYF